MKFNLSLLPQLLLLALLFVDSASAQTDGFDSIFNGKDLTGWSYLPTTAAQKKGRARWLSNDPKAPAWPIVESKVNFNGKVQSEDGRFIVKDEVLTVTVPEAGRTVQMLYSDIEIEGDFILELEFRASKNADSGVFVRGRQLQCRDFPNAGPYKRLKKFKSEDWNKLRIAVNGETALCTCNGEVLEERFKVPKKGPVGIEGDRGKMEYRNIHIKRVDSVARNILKPTNRIGSWILEQKDEGTGSMRVDGDSIVFTTSKTGSKVWHVQAFQAQLNLQEGVEYTVSFEAKANRNDSVVLLQAMVNEPDWHNIGLNETVVLAKKFEKHEFTFTAEKVADKKNRLGFVLGTQTDDVTVRNLILRQAD